MGQVIIIGAGVAGLAAGAALKAAGIPVVLLEGRDRVGGRVLTVRAGSPEVAMELGAEFVHGARNAVWDLVHKAGFQTREVPDRHWQPTADGIVEQPGFWDELQTALPEPAPEGPDRPFADFLRSLRTDSESTRQLARDYVEGFHAAEIERIGVKALACAEAAAERNEGTRQFRLAGGYGSLVQHLHDQVRDEIRVGTRVIAVKWKPGSVTIETESTNPGTQLVFKGAKVLISVPLGILKSTGRRGLGFHPELSGPKRAAIAGLEMGAVRKLTMQFRQRFWSVENFGFVHAPGEAFPVWWSDDRAHLLTGWLGGPRARTLTGAPVEALVQAAAATLNRVFHISANEVMASLATAQTHDWTSDEFSLEAYSYTPVGMVSMPSVLAEPLERTLFFAGEATDSEGDQGTVHAALSSGQRAAREILDST